ncbi:Eco57I restriction-modification methylase domain-containing protein [Enterococcus hirae]|uniref:Eco57I restriction-modification methylase domain-containing protein n=1 Tax=Enterococcus hirae TaxID=1354 RepID=UPI0006B18218|nr:Eco57I restriction-modification methylase domain-containing protein [Enterococcus hirae]MBE8787041.1 restriction endonuclease [Enterococcus hirae]MBE8805546.1 restriction endonuclease [Enterococcus hirae]NBA39690.1 restriction endonuclease [Enterococcus hirae]NBA56209.1 restriction endonuclease [Enterococcus hirae]
MGISFFEEDVDVNEENILHKSPEILKILLRDRTTGRNIVWATKTYELLGKDFKSSETIKVKSITGKNSMIIRPRVEKLKYEQKERTKGKAEVFTPSWIVKKQTDIIEQEFKYLSLEDYITKTWLEITCGEAPYMVNRYDMITGKLIPLAQRFGFVDRKLRRINDEINDEEVWQSLVKKAYQSSYGYEFQGDSLLLARENLFYSFFDYYQEKFGKQPNLTLQTEIAKIISYNVFQMDGLNCSVPYASSHKINQNYQLNLFGELEKTEESEIVTTSGTLVKIKNWVKNQLILFQSLKEEQKMKFDVVIGNPPYQNEGIGEVARDEPVYNKFMEYAYNLADKVCFITPARFLFNAGQTPKKWNEKMLYDTHLKVEFYEQDSAKIFPNTDIKGGLAVTYRDRTKSFGPIITFTSTKELNSILNKVSKKSKYSFNNLLYGKSSYKFSLKLYEDRPDLIERVMQNEQRSISSNIFTKFPEIFFDEKQKKEQVKILGRENNQRVFKWIDKDYIENHPNLYMYKVILPASNGSGAIGEVLSTPLIGEPFVGYTQTFISFGSFDNLNDAEHALKYIKSKFLRTMLGTMKVTQHNQSKEVWKNVPLQDFTSNSDIDWSKSIAEIDQQLYKKYGLNEEEINFIETKVKEMS